MNRAEPRRRARGKRRADPLRARAYGESASPDAVTRLRSELPPLRPEYRPHGAASPSAEVAAPTAAVADGTRGRRIRTDMPSDGGATAPVPSDPVGPSGPSGTALPADTAAASTSSTSSASSASTTPPELALREPDPAPPRKRRRRLGRVAITTVWGLMLALGTALLALAIVGGGTSLSDGVLHRVTSIGGIRIVAGVGSAIVSACYLWGVAGRSGGRPVIFSGLVLAIAAAVLATDDERLRTGAAVMTAAVTAVFAVMATLPARRFGAAVRELLVATAISVVGAAAVIGWEPVVSVSRFQYAALAVSLVGVFAFVYRLGAGLHGLGRRGVLVVAIGAVTLAGTLLYAEMIRRYGTPGLVGHLESGVTWSRVHLHGYPRPIEALLGIPALLWGTHMRARRRQGWWVCAFGVALTAPLASTLVNPELGVVTDLVSLGYSLVVGIVIGLIVIRLDLLLTPSAISRTTSAGRRAAREAEDATAVRPEPRRTQALL